MNETFDRSAEFKIFGKTIRAKNYHCSVNGAPNREKKRPLKLQLSICPTMYCPGHCPFCSAPGSNERAFLDIKKLEFVLRELKAAEAVRGISISGGEPFTDTGLLNEIITLIFDLFGVEMEIGINTNGSGLDRLHEIKRLSYLDTIHISRHSYDDRRNEKYFKTPVPTGSRIAEIVGTCYDPKLFTYNCLLLKDGIGTKEEMIKMLEFAAETGVPKVGFITPMPVNDYARENRVFYRELFDKKDDSMLYTVAYSDFDYCHCMDGVYVSKNGTLVEFYGRETVYGTRDYVRGLVYGADNVLRTGFGKDAEVIFGG